MVTLRTGIVGVGNIGSFHAKNIVSGKVQGLELCALCDTDEAVRTELKSLYPDITIYASHTEMFEKASLDAVIVSTPHYAHECVAVDAFAHGLNVVCEKPLGVTTAAAKRIIAAAEKSDKVFCVMFNQRTNELYEKARQLVSDGTIGEIRRFVWIITNWYRTQYYYNSGGWRGSYGGEGGGVLINQAPHNLDIMQWICGMPDAVTAHLSIGKYHDITVEDEANIFLTYKNGATAAFLTSTGEPCGTNRIEISGSAGKIVIEDKMLKLWKLTEDERDFRYTKEVGFYKPPFEYEEFLQQSDEYSHCKILNNFANAVLHGEKLIADGRDGLNELTISNAAYLSHWKGCVVELPFKEDLFEQELNNRKNDYLSEKKAIKNKGDKPEQRWQIHW